MVQYYQQIPFGKEKPPMDFQLKSFKRELNVSLLANIQYFELTSNYVTAPDRHDFCELIYVDSGEIRIDSEYYTGPLKKNEWILHTANELHAFSCGETVAPNVIIMGFRCTSPSLSVLTGNPMLLDDPLKKMLTEIVREGRNIFMPPYDIPNLKNMPKRKNFEFGSDQLVQNLLECFLLYALRKAKDDRKKTDLHVGEGNERIRSVRDYVDTNFTKSFTVADLTYLFGINRTTLCREFKELTGCTISDYVNKLRVRHTKTLLREGRYSLTEIADILNLSSVHYLSVLFKKYEKLTPTEYASTIKAKYEGR